MPKKTIFVTALTFNLLLFALNVHGQFLPNSNLTKNKFELRVKNYGRLIDAQMKCHNHNVYLNWIVMNDTLEGDFAVFKSKGYCGPSKILTLIHLSKNLAKNVPIMFSAVDSTIDSEYDTYFIVKLDRTLVDVPVDDRIFNHSFASFILPNDRSKAIPAPKKEEVKDLYSQGF